jgi:hypothetical protein
MQRVHHRSRSVPVPGPGRGECAKPSRAKCDVAIQGRHWLGIIARESIKALHRT